MTLVLEIEYLTGVCFAAMGPGSEQPDWPPQPDRIFSALVASWAARGEDAAEAAALEWLEQLDVPQVCASSASPRLGATVFVPPNDPRSGKQKHAAGVLPALRLRQPRRFPASRPERPIVNMLWLGVEPGQEVLAALQRLAADTAYVGHSASLTRCRFMIDSGAAVSGQCGSATRHVYPGRLQELRQSFAAGRRPLPGNPVVPATEQPLQPGGIFAERWLLLEHVNGAMPDLRACALLAKTLRDALLSGYARTGLGAQIPEAVSGHAEDGTPTRVPHLAIAPLPFAGFPYADGHVLGYAVVPPRESALLDDPDFLGALRAIAPYDESRGRRVLMLGTRGGASTEMRFSLELAPSFEPTPGVRSIDPALYIEPSRLFATVTPIVLDRHLKAQGAQRQREVEDQLRAACRRAALPEPDEVLVDNHSALEGIPSAYPSPRSPAWMRWRLPQALASRSVTHAVLRFPSPVRGPMLLGAGRFVGLGLCRPLLAECR